MTPDALKKQLTEEMEGLIAEVLETSQGREMTLTEIEEVVLKARHEFGRRMAEKMVEQQVARQAHKLPQDASGKNLRPKSKKRKRSSHASEK